MSSRRIAAVVRREVRDFRRNRFVIGSMAVMPLVFLITPMITLFRIPDSASGSAAKAAVGVITLFLFIVPIVVPPVIASYSVVGERDQGTLEPVLTAPLNPSELLLGKATAVFGPAIAIAYGMYAVILISIHFGAAPVVRDVVFHPPQVLAQILFTPLLAAWSIWACIGISTRVTDVRAAQQLGTLAGLPLLAFTSLITFQVITPTVPIAAGIAVALLLLDIAGWWVVARLFNRERLITGRPAR